MLYLINMNRQQY